MTPNTEAAKRMWDDYVATDPSGLAAAPEYTVESFGDSPRLADELLELVIDGRKRATAGLVADFVHGGELLPRIGGHWIVCDGAGEPRVILRTVELRVGPFTSVDERFAFDEGEDDRTLESWQDAHRRYFTRVSAARGEEWSENDEVSFERFRVVWPPEHAD
ncbi:uncharacterized protein YhfF [Diaminobutyricimonas aerilata]|uniref:Uncharacterized protein YhfF n=1 Tax=Diaminobutyricimonas aerilata TaxID=1162967 RepID=A0A2M9CI94_9MICO|nr:ASCH domain-containing protein [Diaminobutyricimonas aerilata]PJJ71634.1 uncharacterized protein YhfF [Diaminobutyricimonas aerilata]